MAASLRSRRSWTRWQQKRLTKRLDRLEKKYQLLLQTRDSLLLLHKETDLKLQMATHRLEEMSLSQLQYKQPEALPPAPPLQLEDLGLDR